MKCHLTVVPDRPVSFWIRRLVSDSVLIAILMIAGLVAFPINAGARGAPAPAQQETTPIPTPGATVSASALNLRSGPGTTYAVITVLQQGETLAVIGQHRDCSWLQVRTGQGVEGWVSGAARFVTLHIACAEAPATAPAAATPLPVPPATAEPPASGTILRDNRSDNGRGTLTVENLTPEDGVVAVVLPDDTTYAVAAFYLRSGARYTLAPVPDGGYKLAFTKGRDWSAARGEFTRNVQYRVFEDIFDFTTSAGQYTTWFATLHGVEGGNAGAPPLPKHLFPDLSQP